MRNSFFLLFSLVDGLGGPRHLHRRRIKRREREKERREREREREREGLHCYVNGG